MVASEALISEVTIRDQASAAADRIVAALGRLTKSEEQVQGSAARAGRAIETSGRSFERLKAAVDPVYAAQQRLAQTQLQLNRAVELGVATQAEATALMQRHITVANNATKSGAAGFKSFGGAVQQAGYQIGDFAVQVASGQGVLRPLIQQGTQLVSMFGPWGAVIGAAGATLGALVPVIWSFVTATDSASMSQEKLNDLLKDMDKIQGKLDGNGQRSRQSLQAQLDYDLSQIQSAYDKAKAKFDSEPTATSGPSSLATAKVSGTRDEERKQLIDLTADLEKAKQAAGQFSDSFARAGQDNGSGAASTAKSIREVTAALEEQNRVLQLNKQEREADKIVDKALADLGYTRASANKQILDTLTPLAEAQVKQTQANKAAEDAQRKSVENAKGVASVLSGLKKQYDDLSKASLDVRAADSFGDKAPTEADLARAREWLRLIDEEKTSRAADKQFEQEINQLIDAGTRGVQQRQQWFQTGLQGQQAQIGMLQKQLELSGANDNVSQLALAHLKAQQDVYAQIGNGVDVSAKKYIENADAIARMNQQLTKQRAVAQELPQFFDQAFDRIGSSITQAMATGEIAFSNLLDIGRAVVSELIQEFVKLALLNPLKNWINGDDSLPSIFNLFGGGGGGPTGFAGISGIGNIGASGMLGHAAKGGYIEVGENGPERFYPGVSGTVFPTGTRPGNDNAPSIQIISNVTVNAAGGAPDQNADLAAQVGATVKRELRALVDERLAQHQRKGNSLNPGVAVG